jgi:hypothetical protein
MDLREMLFARAPQDGQWVIVVGGLFPRGAVVEGLYEIVEESELVGCSYQGKRMSCPPYGVYVEQASDGMLLFASSPAVLEAALLPSQYYERLGLGLRDAAGFGTSRQWLWDLPLVRYSSLVPGLRALSQFDGANGKVELGTESFVEVELRPVEGGDLTQLAPTVETLLSAFGTVLSLTNQTDRAGEHGLLARAEVTTTESGKVRVRSPWPRDDIDRAARSLAQVLSSWLVQNASH